MSNCLKQINSKIDIKISILTEIAFFKHCKCGVSYSYLSHPPLFIPNHISIYSTPLLHIIPISSIYFFFDLPFSLSPLSSLSKSSYSIFSCFSGYICYTLIYSYIFFPNSIKPNHVTLFAFLTFIRTSY